MQTKQTTAVLLLLCGLTLVSAGCFRRGTEQAPVPADNPNTNQTVTTAPVTCPTDTLACPDGTVLRRQGADCVFLTCPTSERNDCPTDTLRCPEGTTLYRQGPQCTFPTCPIQQQYNQYFRQIGPQ